MASIRRSPKSKYWIGCYTDVTGKQRQRSTRETDRKAALARAHEYEAAYRRLKTEQQARRVISDIYEEIHGSPLESTSIEKFFKGWIGRKKVELAPTSIPRYQSAVNRFLAFMGDRIQGDLGSLTTTDIAGFRDATAKETSVGSANVILKIIRTALTDAMRDSLLESNPATLVPTIRKKDAASTRRAFSLPELKVTLDHASEEWQGMILTGLYTGQRLGDIARMCWNNVDLAREEIRFMSQKTGRVMILPIAKPLLVWLVENASSDAPDAPLFPHAYDVIETQGRVSTLSNQFNRILSSAGLIDKRKNTSTGKGRSAGRDGSKLSFHCLRHTATSLLKNAGVSEAVAMDIIGHDSKLISQNYTHIEESTKRKALNALPDITKVKNEQ